MTKEGDYESLSQDAAELYLLRKDNLQAQLDSSRLKTVIIIGACIMVSLFLFLFH